MFGYGREAILLQRDVNAVQIPEGNPTTLHQGDIVYLYQSLGGNFTVTTEHGGMLRVAAADADALGKEPPIVTNFVVGTDQSAVTQNIWEAMRTVFDPEIPVNIVELGLVYRCDVMPIATDQHDIAIEMTLTAPGCGMGPVLQQDVEMAIRGIPGVASVRVDVVFDPPWSREMMSEAAKLQLNMF